MRKQKKTAKSVFSTPKSNTTKSGFLVNTDLEINDWNKQEEADWEFFAKK